MQKVETFYQKYEDMFEEYLENIKGNLKNDNEKYLKLQKEYSRILDQNENLTWVLEGQTEDKTLSNKECKALSKLIQIHYDMQSIEEKEIFFLGGRELYFYFKKMNLIKE